MTERELIEELATLGKIYLDCHEAKWSATTTPYIHHALELAELYAYNKLRQFARNYAMMTIEEMAKALPTLDAGTLEELRRNDATFKANSAGRIPTTTSPNGNLPFSDN